MKQKKRNWLQIRRRVSEVVEVGSANDWLSRSYDFFSTFVVIVNITAAILCTFDDIQIPYGHILVAVEHVTAVFFAIDYGLRIWTARFRHPGRDEHVAVRKYVFSFMGIVDLFSWMPYMLPFFFPAGTSVFRLVRVVRVFRLFQINAYYDSLNVIGEVLSNKRQQLVSSVFIILVLMMASSLCMYSLEHEAQPEIFTNAFSGIWWSVSTLLTVGYGDIYPITVLGKMMGIIISFLGVGMVAIPTGIISAGFVDQYSRLKRMTEYAREEEIHFIRVSLRVRDSWTGKMIKDLDLPYGVIVAMIQRGRENIIPRGNVVLKANDTLILGAEALKNNRHIDLKEIILQKYHPWTGEKIMDLNIPRHTFIVMIKRNGRVIVPKGERTLLEGDCLIVYSQEKISDSSVLEL